VRGVDSKTSKKSRSPDVKPEQLEQETLNDWKDSTATLLQKLQTQLFKTDGLSIDQVTAEIINHYNKRLAERNP